MKRPMKPFVFAASALVVILCQLGAAQARDQLGEKDAVVVDHAKSYIFYRSHQRQALRLLREVEPIEMRAWVEARTAAFERAHRRAERDRASYDRQYSFCRNPQDAQSPACLSRLPRPVVPTQETFSFPAPEMDNFVDVNRGPSFTRAENDYTYLIAVPPGTYSIYGQVVANSGSVTGVCLCMGSVRFEARPGQIVDIGEVRFPRIEADWNRGNSSAPAPAASVVVVPPGPGMALPARLSGQPVVQAELRAADKVPNFFGIEIDRMSAIPGVLRYERDRVIDERTGTDPAPAGPPTP